MPADNPPIGAGILQVTSADQLATLAGLRLRWSSPAAISLSLPFVETGLQRTVERRLNFLRGVCGCQAGALFALGALAWSIASPPDAGSTLGAVLRAAAFVVGMGILGKALALLGARALFASQASRLVRRAARRGTP